MKLRQGHHEPRNLWEYPADQAPESKSGHCVGQVFDANLATEIVNAVNAMRAQAGHGTPCEKDPANGTCGKPAIRAVPDKARCTSCEHNMEFHQADGCWFAVEHGRQDKPMGCPCGVPVNREATDE